MTRPVVSWLRVVALGVGLSAMLGYAAWQYCEPHGAFEFAYAPFTPAPLPYSPMRGFTYEQLWGHVRRIALLGPGLLAFTWGLSGYVRLPPPRDWGRVTRWACAGCLLVTAALMLLVLRGRALIDDELAYAMQAGFFGSGHITGPDLGFNPADTFTVPTPLGYSIKYLPGEPLLQIPGTLVGIPALMHLPVVAVTLWAWHAALRRSSGLELARIGTVCLACSPMLMFTSATGLSHAGCLMWVVLMGLGYEQGRGDRPVAGAALAGLSFGFGLLSRPQSMFPIGAVLGLALCFQLLRRRRWLGFAVLGLSAAAGASLLLLYDWQLSGSPWRLPWFLQCGAEHYGFGKVWVLSTYEHGVGPALQNLGVVALRLNSWLLGLPWSLAIVALWLAWGRKTQGAGIWLGVGLAVLLFEFFYYSPGVSDTGAIYHYELLLPFSLMAAVVVQRALERFREVAPLALACALAFGTGTWLVEQALRVERLVSTIHRQSDAVMAQLKAPAVLIYERRENEIVRHGWVFDPFPRRYRGRRDAIVTLPRLATDMRARAARVYPGRECWYFHYRPARNEPELLRCADAATWLERPLIDDDANALPPFVERSTAYLKTDYNPVVATAQQRVLEKDGMQKRLCCQVRALAELGVDLKDASCFETGEP